MKIDFRRLHLLKILNDYVPGQGALDAYMHSYFRRHRQLGSKDRKEVSEKVFSLIRWKSLVEALAAPVQSWEAYLDAFESEAFDLAKTDCTLENTIRLSCPPILMEALARSHGRSLADKLASINNEKAPLFIRANPLKTDRQVLLERLKGRFPVHPCTHSQWGIYFEEKKAVCQTEEFHLGHFEIQDEASQLAAAFVKATPGQRVLDFCSGSGGKTLAMAHHLNGKGQLYLHDIRGSALMEAKKRLKRAGIQNFQTVPYESPHKAKLKKNMNWVIVDAPCSGTGTLRRNPDLKWKFSQEMVQELVGKQRSIFEKALSFLKPGGCIVYITCSVLNEENQEQTRHFLEHYPLELQETWQSLPKSNGMDGLYVAVMKKLCYARLEKR